MGAGMGAGMGAAATMETADEGAATPPVPNAGAAAAAVAATTVSTGSAAAATAGVGGGGKLKPVEAGDAAAEAAAAGETTTALAEIRARRLDVAGVTNIGDAAAAAAAAAGVVKQDEMPAPEGVSGMTHRSWSRRSERRPIGGVSGMRRERSRPGVHGAAAVAVAVAAVANTAEEEAAGAGAGVGVTGSTAGVSGTMTTTPPIVGDRDGGVGGMCTSASAGEHSVPGVYCGVCACDGPHESTGVE